MQSESLFLSLSRITTQSNSMVDWNIANYVACINMAVNLRSHTADAMLFQLLLLNCC